MTDAPGNEGAPNPDADPTTAADVPSEDVKLDVEEPDGTGDSIDPADHTDKEWPGAEEGDERDSDQLTDDGDAGDGDEIDDPQPEEGRK